MSAIDALLQGKPTTSPAKSSGSAIDRLFSQAPTVTPKPIIPSKSLFNPNTPGRDEYIKQLQMREPSTSALKNLPSAIPGGLKAVGKLVTDLPKQLAVSTYKAFFTPS